MLGSLPHLRAFQFGALALFALFASAAATPVMAGGTADGFLQIGTTSAPASMLGVYGGQTIGTSYFSTSAPTNGLLVQGKVGVGTTSPYVSLDLHSNTDALALPVGTTGQEPSNSINGMIRYNTTLTDVEAFIGGYWTTLTTGSGGTSNNYLGTSKLVPNMAASGTDTQTGLYTAGAGDVDFTSQGTKVVEISTGGISVVSGAVGIGTSNPTTPLQINNTSSVAVGAQENAINIQKFYTISDTGNKNGLGVAAVANLPSGSLSALNGVLSIPSLNNTNAGTITNAAAFWARVDVNAGTLTNAYGLKVSDSAGSGSPANQYGVYVGNLASGTSGNYAVYTAGSTPSYFGGNMGLGTTAPSNALDVSGGVAIGTQYVGVTTAPTSGLLVQGKVGIGTTAPQLPLDVIGAGHFGSSSQGVRIQNNGTPGEILGINETNTSYNPLQLRTGVNPTMYLDTAGNVGIGSASPQGVLDVEGGQATSGAGSPINIIGQNGYSSGNLGGAINITAGSAKGPILGLPGANIILTGGSPTLNGKQGIIQILNSAGIGTTAVGSNTSLAVNGGVAVGTYANVATTAGTTNEIITSGSVGIGTSAPSNSLDVSSGVAIGTQYVGVTTAPTSGLLVQGNVGIGTTTPQATLDVQGYVRLALNSSQPASCSTGNDGSLALTHTHNTCVCVGSSAAWVSTVTGATCAW